MTLISKQEKPFFSVIIPCYNVEKQIEKCIDSILNQSFRDYEIILIDDESSDKTGEICDKYRDENRDIIVVHQQNTGLSGARNTGLKIAKGNYIYFLDSDDYIDSNLLEIVYEQIHNESPDCVIFGYRRILDNNIYRISINEKAIYITDTFKKKKNFLLKKYLLGKITTSVWSKIYSNKIIQENNISFVDTKLIMSEDLLFDCCYFLHAKKIVAIDNILYNYVYKDDSLSIAHSEDAIRRYYNLNIELLKYSRNNDQFLDVFPVVFYDLMSRQFKIFLKSKGLIPLCKEIKNSIDHKNLLWRLFFNVQFKLHLLCLGRDLKHVFIDISFLLLCIYIIIPLSSIVKNNNI